MRREIENQNGLHEEETGGGEKNEDEEMRPGPGDAQVFRQGRATRNVGRGHTGGIANRVAGELRTGNVHRRRFCRGRKRRILFGRWLFVGIVRSVIEGGHRTLFAFLAGEGRGQPPAKAAATRGRSNSWWPVMA